MAWDTRLNPFHTNDFCVIIFEIGMRTVSVPGYSTKRKASTESVWRSAMSDVPGVRAPGGDQIAAVPVQTTQSYSAGGYTGTSAGTSETYTSDGAGDGSAGGKAKEVAGQGKQAATQAVGDVKQTATEQAQRVATETKTQLRDIVSDVRDRVGQQAHSQNDKLVGGIRQTADQLDEMRADRQDSPAATIVSRVADSGRQLADYLDRNGPEGVLQEVQDFARRRPGAFLAAALATGFVVGRLGKGVARADGAAGSADGSAKPTSDDFSSVSEALPTTGDGYGPGTAATEYRATGAGTPTVVAVEEEYVVPLGTER
jgi:hypothetical protein